LLSYFLHYQHKTRNYQQNRRNWNFKRIQQRTQWRKAGFQERRWQKFQETTIIHRK